MKKFPLEENQPFVVLNGDSIDILKTIPDNSVDSVVTDPPYGLSDHKPDDVVACLTAWLKGEEYKTNKKGFMGKTWDSWVPGPEVWKEVYRVLKPGGHIIAFAGSRTHDLMSMALRLAGFECRDTVMWIYGSGFPKGLDVSKAIDKAAGAEREVLGIDPVRFARLKNQVAGSVSTGEQWMHGGRDVTITAPATNAARQWTGWGTALKPAFEPALLFRKPLVGTVVGNVLAYGTGALNIDGCRVAVESTEQHTFKVMLSPEANGGSLSNQKHEYANRDEAFETGSPLGRWPANVIHNGSDDVLAGFPVTDKAPAPKSGGFRDENAQRGTVDFKRRVRPTLPVVRGDSGSAARFFYCAKASKRDRDEGLDGFTNGHPTVKPTTLMQYLIRLVTPPNGVVLDPFNGSGSTGKAAMLEGMRYVGIELLQEYVDISYARIQHALDHSDMYQDDEDDTENKPEKQDDDLK